MIWPRFSLALYSSLLQCWADTNVTLVFKDAQVIQHFSREETDDKENNDYTDDTDERDDRNDTDDSDDSDDSDVTDDTAYTADTESTESTEYRILLRYFPLFFH